MFLCFKKKKGITVFYFLENPNIIYFFTVLFFWNYSASKYSFIFSKNVMNDSQCKKYMARKISSRAFQLVFTHIFPVNFL